MFEEFGHIDAYPDLITQVPVEWPKGQGYQFLLHNDGEGEILTPSGETYVVSQFQCDCTEHVFRGYCLHEIWIRQLRPCLACGSVMTLVERVTCFGQQMIWFDCPTCANVRDLALVREERKMGIRDIRLTPQGRCQQAIAWLNTYGSSWFIWQLVYQSPELVSTMVQVLSDADQHILADQIVTKAGFKAA